MQTVLSALLSVCIVCACAVAASADDGRRSVVYQGTEVSYLDLGNPTGLPLVFIHGLSCNTTVWNAQIPAFDQEYRLILIDLPGFGQSGKPQNIDYTMSYFAGAVKAVLDDARAEQPVLVGHSMGYSIVRQFLLEYPRKVRAVINVDGAYFRIPPFVTMQESFKKETQNMIADMTGPQKDRKWREFVESTFYGKTPQSVQKEVFAIMLSADPYASLSSFTEMVRLEQWEEHSFDEPALVMYATSPYLFPGHEAYMRTVFPHQIYEEWDDAGHFLMMEQPERFNASVKNFLQTVESLPQ